MYLNEVLATNWREDEWPDHIEVSHAESRFRTRDYVPLRKAANRSSFNPVDGIWCSRCGWAGSVWEDRTDDDLYDEPQFAEFADFIPRYCPHCGAVLDCDGTGALRDADEWVAARIPNAMRMLEDS